MPFTSARPTSTRDHRTLTVIRLRHDEVYERAEGEALQEAHESLETLKYVRSRLGSFYFASQYQQSPETPDGGLFKRKYFQLVNSLPVPLHHPDGHLFLSIDTAASTSESADYSALSLVFAYDTNYYVVQARRGRWDYEQLQAVVMRYVQRFNGEIIVIVEAAGIGISLYMTLQKQGVRCRPSLFRTT